MEAALLIASLALLIGMVAQLARLPRRRHVVARRIAGRTPLSDPAGSRPVGLGQAPTVD